MNVIRVTVKVIRVTVKVIRVTVKNFSGVNYLLKAKDSQVVCVDHIGETAVIEDGDLEEKGRKVKLMESSVVMNMME